MTVAIVKATHDCAAILLSVYLRPVTHETETVAIVKATDCTLILL